MMKLKKILFIIIITLVSIEAAFRLDPNGLLKYKISMHRISMTDGPNFRPMPGVYPLDNGQVTVPDVTTRYLPDSSNASCKIAIVGDSVTFGWETDDYRTWANLLAADYTDVQFDNYGVAGYNVKHVANLLKTLDYDGYIYLFFENDDVEEMSILDYTAPVAAITYLYAMTFKPTIVEMTPEEVLGVLNSIPSNTFVFGFDKPKTAALSKLYPINIIPFYHSFISNIDWHPNDEGHRFIYDQIRGKITTFTNSICGTNNAVKIN